MIDSIAVVNVLRSFILLTALAYSPKQHACLNLRESLSSFADTTNFSICSIQDPKMFTNSVHYAPGNGSSDWPSPPVGRPSQALTRYQFKFGVPFQFTTLFNQKLSSDSPHVSLW